MNGEDSFSLNVRHMLAALVMGPAMQTEKYSAAASRYENR